MIHRKREAAKSTIRKKGAWQKKKTGMPPDKPKRNRTFADC